MTEGLTGNSMADQKVNYHNKPPLPVDRGWAWFILIGAYVMMLIPFAFARSLSIFLPDILDRYNEPATVTTLAFGMGDLSWSLTNIILPALLLPRFSVRTLALCGAFFQCFAVIALAYSSNIIMFNCLLAVIGCSSCMMIIPSLIHLGHYFKKRLSFASAVTQVGGSTAMVIVPRLAQFLKDNYGYQGAMLILGGLSFHSVAAAMLLWPVSMFDETDSTKEVPDHSSKNGNLELSDIDPVQMTIVIPAPEEEEGINEDSKLLQVIDLKTKNINELNSTTKCNDIINGQLKVENKDFKKSELIPLSETTFSSFTPQSFHNEVEKLSSRPPDLALDSQVNKHSDSYTQNEHSVSYASGDTVSDSKAAVKEAQATYDKCEYVRRSSIEENVSNQTALIQDGSNHIQGSTTIFTSRDCCRLNKIKAYLSSSVLLNPVAVMLIIAGGLSTPGGNMYLPVLGLENGLSPAEVPWVLTIIGISDILGKLAIGFFADLGYLRPIRIASITQFTIGMVCQFTMFYKGFGPMAGMAVIFGMTNGVVQSLIPPMVIELLGLPYLAQVTSICYLTTGITTFALNVSVGAIKDATGSFFRGFNLLGGMLLTSCVILILEPLFVRCRDKFSKHAKNSHNNI